MKGPFVSTKRKTSQSQSDTRLRRRRGWATVLSEPGEECMATPERPEIAHRAILTKWKEKERPRMEPPAMWPPPGRPLASKIWPICSAAGCRFRLLCCSFFGVFWRNWKELDALLESVGWQGTTAWLRVWQSCRYRTVWWAHCWWSIRLWTDSTAPSLPTDRTLTDRNSNRSTTFSLPACPSNRSTTFPLPACPSNRSTTYSSPAYDSPEFSEEDAPWRADSSRLPRDEHCLKSLPRGGAWRLFLVCGNRAPDVSHIW